MKNVGLIIQGPLRSYGRMGTDAHVSSLDPNDFKLVDYDTRENIKRTIDEFGHLFEKIVVSTWENELLPGDSWEGVEIISAPDPGGIEIADSKKYKYKDNNKFRQFISIKNGIEGLEKNKEIKHVVKIRTDQFVDLKKLLECFSKNSDPEGNKDQIFVPVIHPGGYMLHDLYFASTIRAMKEFCDAILKFEMFEFIDSVHREMVLKHAYVCYRNIINVPEWAYFPWFPPMGACNETKQIFSYMFENVYVSLGKEVFQTVVWRGGLSSSEYINNHFKKEKELQPDRNIPGLISIDWERYYTFKSEVLEKDVTLLNRVHIRVGRLGWLLLSKLRAIKSKIVNLHSIKKDSN